MEVKTEEPSAERMHLSRGLDYWLDAGITERKNRNLELSYSPDYNKDLRTSELTPSEKLVAFGIYIGQVQFNHHAPFSFAGYTEGYIRGLTRLGDWLKQNQIDPGVSPEEHFRNLWNKAGTFFGLDERAQIEWKCAPQNFDTLFQPRIKIYDANPLLVPFKDQLCSTNREDLCLLSTLEKGGHINESELPPHLRRLYEAGVVAGESYLGHTFYREFTDLQFSVLEYQRRILHLLNQRGIQLGEQDRHGLIDSKGIMSILGDLAKNEFTANGIYLIPKEILEGCDSARRLKFEKGREARDQKFSELAEEMFDKEYMELERKVIVK